MVLKQIATLIDAMPGVYGGQLRLARSGFPLVQLAPDYRAGMRIPDFLEAYPEIDEESFFAGIACYLANRSFFDEQLGSRDAQGESLLADWLDAHARAW